MNCPHCAGFGAGIALSGEFEVCDRCKGTGRVRSWPTHVGVAPRQDARWRDVRFMQDAHGFDRACVNTIRLREWQRRQRPIGDNDAAPQRQPRETEAVDLAVAA